MALRTKTIEYAMLTDSRSVATVVTRNFPPFMVYIPETGSRSFRSCFVEVDAKDNVLAATTVTGWKFMYKVGAGTAFSASNTVSITNTGENMAFTWTQDVTPAFTSGFVANSLSQSFIFGMIVTGSATVNAGVRLHCTYDYDDAAQTRIKTVTIPMDSYFGTASATGSTGTYMDSIPALDTYLPEANKVYRNVSMEFIGNDFMLTTGSNVGSCSFGLDNELHGFSGSVTGPFISTLISACFFKYQWNITPFLNTSTTHSVWVKSSRNGLPFSCLAGRLVATYEYDHANSTKVMNCIALSAADDSGYMGGAVSGSRSRFTRGFYIQEPEITMSRCGVYHSLVDGGTVTFIPSVTQGAFTQSLLATTRSYVFPAVITCGGWMTGHRFDSEARGGQGMNIVRGRNLFVTDWYRTGTAAGTLGSGYTAKAYLNYESAKSSQPGGDANHSQIRNWYFSPVETAAIRTIKTSSVLFAETSSYWLTSLGAQITLYTVAAGGNIAFLCSPSGSDEGEGGYGWDAAYAGTVVTDGEIGPFIAFCRMRDLFKKYPEDPNSTLYNVLRPRTCSVDSSTAINSTGYLFATYHTIKYTLTGSISGSAGNGSGITVDFFRSDTDELVASATTNVGGSFQKTYYDNTIPLYAVAREDDTHVGRSANSTASGMP